MLDSLLLLLAHGADPRPIRLDEATANMVKFFVTILLALVMCYPVLAPLFPKKGQGQNDQPAEASESNSGVVGWVALGLLLVLSMAWWLTRTSIVELTTKEAPMPEHAHVQEKGGQVAMWADFHAEVARIESGEVRIYLSDSYNRPIAARFFDAEITTYDAASETALAGDDGPDPAKPSATPSLPAALASATPLANQGGTGLATEPPDPGVNGQTPKQQSAQPHPTIPALNETYRFARMSREDKAYRVKVKTPGWTVTLKFAFDGGNGRRSLPIWCGESGPED